jgi:AraC-like DNA-binding protein
MKLDDINISIFTEGYVPADLKLLNQLKVLLEKNFKESRNPEHYASQLNISLKRLNRLTQHYCRQSVYQLLQDRIHQEAELLLKHTTLSVKEIANELGVCDPAHFNKCFKQRTGYSPGEYRKLHHN